MLVRLLCLATLLLPVSALAQAMGEEAKVCNDVGLSGFDYDEYRAREWPQEAQRIKGDAPNVARQDNRLRLEIDGGKVVDLYDCLNGDGSYGYLYERYDGPGGFYVVGTPAYEDFYYTLVMKKTGKTFAIPALPVWSPDRSRFAYAVCNLLNARAQIAVMRMVGGQPKLQGEVPLPCISLGDCRIVWESNTVVSADCHAHPGQASSRELVRLTRQGASWMATTSNR